MPESSNVVLTLNRDEVQLIRAALRLLEDTLGKEEADELRAVKALIAKIDAASA